jgi:hypothetical protein
VKYLQNQLGKVPGYPGRDATSRLVVQSPQSLEGSLVPSVSNSPPSHVDGYRDLQLDINHVQPLACCLVLAAVIELDSVVANPSTHSLILFSTGNEQRRTIDITFWEKLVLSTRIFLVIRPFEGKYRGDLFEYVAFESTQRIMLVAGLGWQCCQIPIPSANRRRVRTHKSISFLYFLK